MGFDFTFVRHSTLLSQPNNNPNPNPNNNKSDNSPNECARKITKPMYPVFVVHLTSHRVTKPFIEAFRYCSTIKNNQKYILVETS